MAKRKKESITITAEERLKEALVPENKQSYQIPSNWCWTYLTKGAAECLDSYRKPINATERERRIGDIPYYGATGQVGWINDYLTNEQLVLVGEDGAPFLDANKNKAYIIEGKSWVNNHAHILRSFFGTVGNRLLKHYLDIFDYRNFVNGSTRLKLTQGNLDLIPVPVPPIAEQQRIVDRIESLFSKLDEVEEKLQSVLDSFETRKAAILHKAFIGELTAKWRSMHEISLESWKNEKFGSLIVRMQNGISKRHGTDGMPWIVLRLVNLSNDNIETKDLRTINLTEQESQKYKIEANDVLMIRVNGSKDNVGKQYQIKSEANWAFCDHIFRVRYNESTVTPAYMTWFSKTRDYKDFVLKHIVSSAGQNTISQKAMANLNVPIPMLEEQMEIVQILDVLLQKEERIKGVIKSGIIQIERMKQSILSKAFHGGLRTNNPADEDARELIKKIMM